MREASIIKRGTGTGFSHGKTVVAIKAIGKTVSNMEKG